MFKIGSFEKELIESMEKNLVKNQIEKTSANHQIDKAANFLSAAANLFKKAGMAEEANEISQIINSLKVK
jgi:hypothetical protein